jgi:hypothetical protein
MIFNWIVRGDFELEKDLQASPESYDACNPVEFYGEPILELSKPRLDSGLQAITCTGFREAFGEFPPIRR